MAIKVPILTTDQTAPQRPIHNMTETAIPEIMQMNKSIQGAISGIQENVNEYLHKNKVLDDTLKIGQTQISVTNDNEKMVEGLRKNPDPDNYFNNWQTGFRENVKQKLDQIQNPELRKKTGIYLGQMELHQSVQQAEYAVDLKKRANVAEGLNLIDAYENVDDYKNAIGIVQGLVDNGDWKADFGEQQKILIKDRMEKKAEFKNYKTAANEAILYPEKVDQIIKDFNLTPDRAFEVRKQAEIELDRRDRVDEKRDRLISQKEDSDFLARVSQPSEENGGFPTIAEVNASTMDTSTKRYYIGIINNSVKSKKATTDNGFAISLLDSILSLKEEDKNKSSTKELRSTILREASKDPDDPNDPPKLNLAQAEMLDRAYHGKMNEKAEKPHYTSDPYFSLTKEYFRSELGVKEDISPVDKINMALRGEKPPTKANKEKYFEATMKLMQAVEKKGLSGGAIWDEGQKILNDTFAGMKNKKDNFGYELGEERIRPDGQRGRYIGNDKWQIVK